MSAISFLYRNHRGEERLRWVDVDRIEYLPTPGFGYQAGWFVSGRCHDKDEMRSFALSHIVLEDNRHPFTLLGAAQIKEPLS
jgi:hypothetical protein